MGTQLPSQNRSQSSQFSTQLAPPRKKGTTPHPTFSPCLLWPNGWMDQDATHLVPVNLILGDVVLDKVAAPPSPLKGSRPRSRPVCVRRGPSSPPLKGNSSPPLYGPWLLWPRLPISATAELLYVHYAGGLVLALPVINWRILLQQRLLPACPF